MDTFLQKHRDKVTGVLSCPDRVIFKGHLSLGFPRAMEGFLARQGLLIKDFKTFCRDQSQCLKRHAELVCRRLGRSYLYINRFERKEDYVRKIAERDGVTGGLICVLACLESCASFQLRYGEGRPRLVASRPKCLCLYYYYLDREFGFMHVRLQTWFPFTVQVYVNGHDWLRGKLDRHGVGYTMEDNAFTRVEAPSRAQRFADGFVSRNWPRILDAFAARVNPLLKTLLDGHRYYWVADQFEYATDVMFKDRQALKPLYKELLGHATLCFSAEDVLVFLGRKLQGQFKGEVLNDAKKRHQGARVKHRMKENWIKMYDKFGCVLRVETVINHPYEFRVRRRAIRRGRETTGWFPMAKSVANLPRYAEVCLMANQRYLAALAVVDDPDEPVKEMAAIAKPVRKNNKSHRALNPLATKDMDLFRAVMRGEHLIKGFACRDIRAALHGGREIREKERRKQSANVSRLLAILHAHKLIAKIPRTRRWVVTQRGQKSLGTAIAIFEKHCPMQYRQNVAC